MDYDCLLNHYRGRRVLVTGHTGFKGAWLCRILELAGADVAGYSLEAPTEPNLFGLARIGEGVRSEIGDVRDFEALLSVFRSFRPEVVLHLAAQPIVRESYRDPRGTYESNVMGTVNILECARLVPGVQSVLNVTTDKVYLNREWEWGYREDEQLDGYDPYSNSKSCSELVTHSYARSFLSDEGVAVSTARAGNVIGGGDFAADRIVPDCVRAAVEGVPVVIRNPGSTRPYQHVLEPLFAYLDIADRQLSDSSVAGWYNVGPDECDCVTTWELVALLKGAWDHVAAGEGLSALEVEVCCDAGAPHEANFLKLDCSRIKRALGWSPTWRIDRAVEEIANWSAAWAKGVNGEGLRGIMNRQIRSFVSDASKR